jgi:hypothetical protein
MAAEEYELGIEPVAAGAAAPGIATGEVQLQSEFASAGDFLRALDELALRQNKEVSVGACAHTNVVCSAACAVNGRCV